MKRIIYLLLAVLLTVGGCKKDNKEEKTGSIHGIVSEKKTGNPVNAARVEVGTCSYFSYKRPEQPEILRSTVTGNDGYYEFDNLRTDVSPYIYYIKVSKENYQDEYYNFNIEGGKVKKNDFFMITYSKVYGVATYNGNPVLGVSVSLKNEDINSNQTVQTHSQGYYEFKTVSGKHRLVFFGPEFRDYPLELNIADGDDYERNVELRK